jgi:hypothetical protein
MDERPKIENRGAQKRETQQRLEAWSKKVNTLWTQDAQKVTDLLEYGDDCVIIDGQWRSGKTYNMLPEIKRIGFNKGWVCTSIDARKIIISSGATLDQKRQEITDRLDRLPTVDSGQTTGLIILDESGSFESPEDSSMFVQECQARGYTKFVYIPAGDDDVRPYLISSTQKSFLDKGLSAKTYVLDKKNIPEDLSREYFEITHTSQEVADFAVANLPLSPYILSSIRGFKTISDVKLWWTNIMDTMKPYASGFDFEELKRVDEILCNYK